MLLEVLLSTGLLSMIENAAASTIGEVETATAASALSFLLGDLTGTYCMVDVVIAVVIIGALIYLIILVS